MSEKYCSKCGKPIYGGKPTDWTMRQEVIQKNDDAEILQVMVVYRTREREKIEKRG